MGNNAEEDAEMIEGLVAMEMEETPIIGMIIKIGEPAAVKDSETFITIKGVDKTTHVEADEDSGMEMTLITMTQTIGIEIPTVKVILTGVEDGIIVVEVKDIMIVEREMMESQSTVSRARVSTRIPLCEPKSLSSTTYGTSIQIPNPI